MSCQPDITLRCSLERGNFFGNTPTVVISHRRQIVINLNVTNEKSLAYDAVTNVIFNPDLYLSPELALDSKVRW